MAGCRIAKWVVTCKTIKFQPIWSYPSKRLHSQIPQKKIKVPVKEIQIPVKYGHIAAKLWGSGEKRPILALHGWQDNAGTWDPLIPLIIKDRPILAIDFPGHGLSTSYPPGMMYYLWELPRFILYIKEHFKWDKISILGHSMGAIAAMRYACIYEDDVDYFISIDGLIYDDYDFDLVINRYPKLLQKGLVAQTRLDQEPPTYTMEEIKQIWHIGSNKSVGLENVQFLIERGVKQSNTDPNKYYFARDVRLKYVLFIPESKRFVISLMKRLKCPTLCIKGRDSRFSKSKFSADMCDTLSKNNVNFELKCVPGTHHVHLNNPEVVAPLIVDFISRFDVCVS